MKRIITCIAALLVLQNANAQKYFDSTFYDDGKLSGYGFIDRNKGILILYRFYTNGQISSVKHYDSLDYMHSYRETVYHMNGKTALIYHYPTGPFIEYFSNGKLQKKDTLYNNFKTGKWKEYFSNGKLYKEYYFTLSSEDSSVNQQLTWENKSLFNYGYENFEWGEPDSTLPGGMPLVNLTKAQFFYLKPRPTGKWKTYNEQGNLISIEDYDKKEKKK